MNFNDIKLLIPQANDKQINHLLKLDIKDLMMSPNQKPSRYADEVKNLLKTANFLPLEVSSLLVRTFIQAKQLSNDVDEFSSSSGGDGNMTLRMLNLNKDRRWTSLRIKELVDLKDPLSSHDQRGNMKMK